MDGALQALHRGAGGCLRLCRSSASRQYLPCRITAPEEDHASIFAPRWLPDGIPGRHKNGEDTADEASHRQGNCSSRKHQTAGLRFIPNALCSEVCAGEGAALVRLNISDLIGEIQRSAVQLQRSLQRVPHADDAVGALQHLRENRNGPMMSDWRTVNGAQRRVPWRERPFRWIWRLIPRPRTVRAECETVVWRLSAASLGTPATTTQRLK